MVKGRGEDNDDDVDDDGDDDVDETTEANYATQQVPKGKKKGGKTLGIVKAPRISGKQNSRLAMAVSYHPPTIHPSYRGPKEKKNSPSKTQTNNCRPPNSKSTRARSSLFVEWLNHIRKKKKNKKIRGGRQENRPRADGLVVNPPFPLAFASPLSTGAVSRVDAKFVRPCDMPRGTKSCGALEPHWCLLGWDRP